MKLGVHGVEADSEISELVEQQLGRFKLVRGVYLEFRRVTEHSPLGLDVEWIARVELRRRRTIIVSQIGGDARDALKSANFPHSSSHSSRD